MLTSCCALHINKAEVDAFVTKVRKDVDAVAAARTAEPAAEAVEEPKATKEEIDEFVAKVRKDVDAKAMAASMDPPAEATTKKADEVRARVCGRTGEGCSAHDTPKCRHSHIAPLSTRADSAFHHPQAVVVEE